MDHETDHHKEDPDCGAPWGVFVIARQAAMLNNPGEDPIDNPELARVMESVGLARKNSARLARFPESARRDISSGLLPNDGQMYC